MRPATQTNVEDPSNSPPLTAMRYRAVMLVPGHHVTPSSSPLSTRPPASDTAAAIGSGAGEERRVATSGRRWSRGWAVLGWLKLTGSGLQPGVGGTNGLRQDDDPPQ